MLGNIAALQIPAADGWRWLTTTVVDTNREVGLLASLKRKSAMSLFVMLLWKNSGEWRDCCLFGDWEWLTSSLELMQDCLK